MMWSCYLHDACRCCSMLLVGGVMMMLSMPRNDMLVADGIDTYDDGC